MATTTTTYNLCYQVKYKGSIITSQNGLNIASFSMNYPEGTAKKTITPTNGTMTKLGTFSMAGKYCQNNAKVYGNVLQTAGKYLPNDIEVFASRTATTYYYWNRYYIGTGYSYSTWGFGNGTTVSYTSNELNYSTAQGTAQPYGLYTLTSAAYPLDIFSTRLFQVNQGTGTFEPCYDVQWVNSTFIKSADGKYGIYYKGGGRMTDSGQSSANYGLGTAIALHRKISSHNGFGNIGRIFVTKGSTSSGAKIYYGYNTRNSKINCINFYRYTGTAYQSSSYQKRGSYIDRVSSTSSTAYPENGVSGSYWYTQV